MYVFNKNYAIIFLNTDVVFTVSSPYPRLTTGTTLHTIYELQSKTFLIQP